MPETRTTSSTGGQKGTKLARFDLIPVGPLTQLAEHYGKGARKYASHQWRNGYEWSKTYAACMRHLTAWWAGFDYDVCSNDPEGCSFVTAEGEPYEPFEPDTCYNHTGSHHLAAVAWHSFAGLEFAERFPEHDDRYKPGEEEDVDIVEFRSWGEEEPVARVRVGHAKLLREDGWEEVGYTTDGVDLSAGTHDGDGVVDVDLSSLFKPQTLEVEIEGLNLDMIKALFGVFDRPVRFEASAGGMRDLKHPLPAEVEESIDDGWVLIDLLFGKWFLTNPEVMEQWRTDLRSPIPVKSWLPDYDAEHQPARGYVGEYRDLLRKHAPTIDAVGGLL